MLVLSRVTHIPLLNLLKNDISFSYMCLYVCVWVHVSKSCCPWRPEVLDLLELELQVVVLLSDMDVGNLTWVL